MTSAMIYSAFEVFIILQIGVWVLKKMFPLKGSSKICPDFTSWPIVAMHRGSLKTPRSKDIVVPLYFFKQRGPGHLIFWITHNSRWQGRFCGETPFLLILWQNDHLLCHVKLNLDLLKDALDEILLFCYSLSYWAWFIFLSNFVFQKYGWIES